MPKNKEAAYRYSIIDKRICSIYKPYPSMAELIDALESELGTSFSVSTIQKDIQAMKHDEQLGYNAPIRFAKARNGYYYEDPKYTIRSFGLNEREIEAIEFATGILAHFRGLKVNEAYNQAVEKIRTSLNIKKGDRDSNLKNAVQMEDTTHLRGMDDFEKFMHCIKEHIAFSFVHYSYDRQTFKAHVIHPYLLKESNKRWYVVGFSEEHQAIRYFGVDRIYDPVLLALPFKEHLGQDLRDHFRDKIGLTAIAPVGKEKTEKVTVWVSREWANYFQSMPLHHSQKIVHILKDGELLIEFTLIPTYELLALLQSYGNRVMLQQPKWLVKKMRDELEKNLQQYQ